MKSNKLIAEFIGTATLVVFGCGTAMITGCDRWGGYLLTALAFGLVIAGMAYCVGNVSGCHINPAVSLGVLLTGGMDFSEFLGYVIAQIFGATAGAVILSVLFYLAGLRDATASFGSNGLAGVNGSAGAGLLAEVILTYVFVLIILGVTSAKAGHGSMAGMVIGWTLVLIHIFGIALTGTSVNPARSIGPAVVAAFTRNSVPLSALWVFILGPLIGASLAACTHRSLEK